MNIEEGKALNHLIHMEERIIHLLKSSEDQGEISEKEKNDLCPSGSKPEALYGFAKIHKALEDGIPSFRPILSAIGAPTYKLAKFCDQLLKPLTNNEYTIRLFFICYKATFHQHTSNRNVKPLCTKPLQKSDTCWQFDKKFVL